MRIALTDKMNMASAFSFVLGCLKFIIFTFLMMIHMFHHFIVSLLIWDENLRLKYFMKSISFMAKTALYVLNVKVDADIASSIQKKLIVSNHLSYIDVLIYAAFCPSLFITSEEIRETPVLGKLAELSGCFFVERRKDKRTSDTKDFELKQIKEKLALGFNIFLFPEGTSSDGRGVLPFKSTFFQLAVDGEVGVVPIALLYQGAGKKIVPWYGSMTFPDHLFRLCLQKEISAKIIQLGDVLGNNRLDLAHETFERISGEYGRN